METKDKENAGHEFSTAGEEIESRKKHLQFPVWKPIRRKFRPDHPFFAAGNVEREFLAKQVSSASIEDEKSQNCSIHAEDFWDIPCPIIGCGARLNSMENLEDHYFTRHMASCLVCSTNFPTMRLLNMHVSESHDSFFKAKVACNFPMYECLVEGCGAKFKTNGARHQHVVDKHKFPRSFVFYKGIPPKHQQKRTWARDQIQNQVGQSDKDVPSNGNHMNAEKVEVEIDALASAVSKLSTGPSTINFGHRRRRAFGFVRQNAITNAKSSPSPSS